VANTGFDLTGGVDFVNKWIGEIIESVDGYSISHMLACFGHNVLFEFGFIRIARGASENN